MCDIDGNVKPGQLPMAMKAELYRGTARVTGYVGMTYYPVSGGDDLIDPAPGVPYPVEPVVTWFLLNAPPGVTVNKWEGLITVAENAVLDVSNDITVLAVWRGETYTILLHLGKVFDGRRGEKGDEGKQGSPAPHYRGKVVSWPDPSWSPGLVEIVVNATKSEPTKMNPGDWVAYVGKSSYGVWVPGKCVKWNGIDWEQVSSENETSLYMTALMDLTEGAPDGTFTAVFCRVIAAQQAFINELQTQLIQVQNAIFGGERFEKRYNADGSAYVVDLGTDKAGYRLKADGSGEFSSIIISGASAYSGMIVSGPLYLSNETPVGNETVYEIGTKANLISSTDSSKLIIGKYGAEDIIRIFYYWNRTPYNGKLSDLNYTYIGIIYVYRPDGSEIQVAKLRYIREQVTQNGYKETILENDPLKERISFRYRVNDDNKTLKLIGIPNIVPQEPGVVYRDGNTLKIK
jgi:hypothetical protein